MVDKKERRNWNNLKVGDMIRCEVCSLGGYSVGQVTKLTDAGFSYVVWLPTEDAYYIATNKAIAEGEHYLVGKFKMSIADNLHLFTISKTKSERWDKQQTDYRQLALTPTDSRYGIYSVEWDHGR